MKKKAASAKATNKAGKKKLMKRVKKALASPLKKIAKKIKKDSPVKQKAGSLKRTSVSTKDKLKEKSKKLSVKPSAPVKIKSAPSSKIKTVATKSVRKVVKKSPVSKAPASKTIKGKSIKPLTKKIKQKTPPLIGVEAGKEKKIKVSRLVKTAKKAPPVKVAERKPAFTKRTASVKEDRKEKTLKILMPVAGGIVLPKKKKPSAKAKPATAAGIPAAKSAVIPETIAATKIKKLEKTRKAHTAKESKTTLKQPGIRKTGGTKKELKPETVQKIKISEEKKIISRIEPAAESKPAVKAKAAQKAPKIPAENETKPVAPAVEYPSLPTETLPSEYGENGITLIVVDPLKIFAFWEVKEDTLKIFNGDLIIRLYDVTGINLDCAEPIELMNIKLRRRLGDEYISVLPGREYLADLGIIYSEGIFISVARSNKVKTPCAMITEAEPHEDVLETVPVIGY